MVIQSGRAVDDAPSNDKGRIGADRNERGGCDDIGLTSVVTVEIDAPLGERQLVYDRRDTAAAVSSDMSVDGPLVVSAEFEVSFVGRLRENRDGYFWIQELDGTQVALLRSDGNPEIPMSCNVDIANAGMLDDGLSGESSMLVLPPQIEPGQYHLCTTNSADDVLPGRRHRCEDCWRSPEPQSLPDRWVPFPNTADQSF